MKKYTAQFKFPCNFNTNTPQAEEWRKATPETYPDYYGISQIVVTDSGDIYVKKPKHTTGVINMRSAGGKWEKLSSVVLGRGAYKRSVEQFLSDIGAVEAKFAGGPRV
jgi:hypothetical protein